MERDEDMKKIIVVALLITLIFPVASFTAKAQDKTGCGASQFKMAAKAGAKLKAKESAASKTLKTYKKKTELYSLGRTGSWYKVCHSGKTAYLSINDATELFTANEKAIFKKLDRRKGVTQAVAVTGDTMSGTKVTIQTYEKKKGEWRRALKKIKGVIGKNGFAVNKKEGDGKAPVGIYSFGTAFGSKAKPAGVKLDYRKTTAYDYWIDDQTSNDYNKWKTYKGNPSEKWKSFERMNHELYKYGAVIRYNMDPIVKGKGSAIFLHIWRGENSPTAGCTATSEKNVLSLLKWLDPKQDPKIILGTPESLKSVK